LRRLLVVRVKLVPLGRELVPLGREDAEWPFAGAIPHWLQ
jgi:hypothetical protein